MFRFELITDSNSKLTMVLKMSGIVFIFMVSVGVVIHYLEPDVYPSIFDGMWWAIVTISTVGYGDFVPEGTIGRIIGMILIVSGIALFSFFITNLASSAIANKQERDKGGLAFHRSGHFIIVGWNERCKELLKQLAKIYPKAEFVLIDGTLQHTPKTINRLTFVKGSPMIDDTFARANISEAHTIIITANLHIDEKTADTNSVVTLLTAKGMNSTIYSIVELLTTEQLKNIERAGADEIIESSKQISLLMTNGVANHGMSDVVFQVLQHKENNQLKFSPLPSECINESFAATIRKLQNDDCFLLGILRDGETILHPPKSSTLLKGDQLIFYIRTNDH
ncbi:potassium channel family protein [Evansella halocellulosilytica]|uniref:potassium channel family protein n=1 Tax=Evansella halocellulosilytica TaxID=2011013 RepID=UPI0015CB8483|nr:potassium channel protein [Evansella halocellulosilytica]